MRSLLAQEDTGVAVLGFPGEGMMTIDIETIGDGVGAVIDMNDIDIMKEIGNIDVEAGAGA